MTMNPTSPRRVPLLSDDPGVAWVEARVLAYMPVWIGAVAAAMFTGTMSSWGDAAYLLFSLALVAPLVAVPLLWPAATDRARPLRARYWVKLQVFIAIFAFVANYFFTEYFFDVLGMHYAFPTTWNLDAALLGSGRESVPLALYLLTHVYFVTYYVLIQLGVRLARRPFARLSSGARRVAEGAALVALSYAMAFGETLFMANDALADFFWYEDRSRMLVFGSLFYALYFIFSAPFVLAIDRRGPTPLARVALWSLASGMLVFLALDVVTGWIGRL